MSQASPASSADLSSPARLDSHLASISRSGEAFTGGETEAKSLTSAHAGLGPPTKKKKSLRLTGNVDEVSTSNSRLWNGVCVL